jgi:DNA polymerase-3 subunit epsilon
VKELQPIHNRLLRRERGLVAWQLSADDKAKPSIKLVNMDALDASDLGQVYGPYRSKRQAMDALRLLADTHGLCPQYLGLESGKGACFASQIGKCKGVCAGRETTALHRVRLQMALAQQRLQAWPHQGKIAIREHHTASGRTDIHVFDQWCHIATVQDDEALSEANRSRHALAFDLDTYRLLNKRLSAPLGRDKSVYRLPDIREENTYG